MTDAAPTYTFTCPNCAGSFSILLERIPPVRARFRCPHCKQPMDFPSRDEARVYASLQTPTPSHEAAPPASPAPPAQPAPRPTASRPSRTMTLEDPPADAGVTESTRFRVEKPGWEMDVYDRRALRNLIRTGEILANDGIRVDNGDPVPAGELPYLRSLFSLRKQTSAQPPICCRTHTDKVAFFRCHDTGRPLCDDCSPERKFGGTTIRVCGHCGGAAEELVHAGS